MNLQLLNNGVPDGKLWLNPVCNVLTCNQVVSSSPPPGTATFFNMAFTGSAALPINITNPCTGISIPNPNINIAANTFTAPANCFLSVDVQLSIFYTVASISLNSNLGITVNGGSTYLFTSVGFAFSGTVGAVPVSCSGVLRLNAGDVVGLSLTSTGGGSGFQYGQVSFSGTVY
jgi:hypothetical protein